MQRYVQCPAGEEVDLAEGGIGCRCRIERVTLSPRSDPRTLMSYCLGAFIECPTWRAAREAEWEGRRRAMERELVAVAKAAGEV